VAGCASIVREMAAAVGESAAIWPRPVVIPSSGENDAPAIRRPHCEQ
jgi:hypothetical protein